jgi:hypothetical protein
MINKKREIDNLSRKGEKNVGKRITCKKSPSVAA